MGGTIASTNQTTATSLDKIAFLYEKKWQPTSHHFQQLYQHSWERVTESTNQPTNRPPTHPTNQPTIKRCFFFLFPIEAPVDNFMICRHPSIYPSILTRRNLWTRIIICLLQTGTGIFFRTIKRKNEWVNEWIDLQRQPARKLPLFYLACARPLAKNDSYAYPSWWDSSTTTISLFVFWRL